MELFEVVSRILVFTSIAMLLYGWGKRNITGHWISAFGWLLFGIFWLLRVPYYLGEGEVVNAVYCILGFPLFSFLAYHEFLCNRWGDDPSSLGFMAGTVGISAGMYFLIDTFSQVAALFVWTTAWETAKFLSLFGYESSIGSVNYGNVVKVPVYHGSQGGISIILACTAIQSIVIFIAAILTTNADKTRKWKAFLYTVPVILILNIIRTGGVIFLVYEGHTGFHFAHNILSRWTSMLVLVVLSFYMFEILPELHENIVGIPGLLKRKSPETLRRERKKDIRKLSNSISETLGKLENNKNSTRVNFFSPSVSRESGAAAKYFTFSEEH